jgi:tight adherence protein B
MGGLLQNPLFVYPALAICVFGLAYVNSERILEWFYARTLGQREELYALLDSLYVETDRKKVTTSLYLLTFGIGAIVFLAFWPSIFTGLFFGITISIVGWSVPKIMLKSMWEKRCNRLVNQMVDGMTIMGNGIRSGLSITQTMERVVQNMNGPLPQELNLVLNKVRLGLSVEEALNEFGDRIPRQDVQMFVTSVNILKETGGNLAETFETIVLTVRERQKIEKRIEAMTTQGMTQAVILTLVPFILLIVFLMIDPTFVKPLFTKPLGWVFLIVMLGLQVIGGVAMKKVVTIKV